MVLIELALAAIGAMMAMSAVPKKSLATCTLIAMRHVLPFANKHSNWDQQSVGTSSISRPEEHKAQHILRHRDVKRQADELGHRCR
jgi:hypothetical protein